MIIPLGLESQSPTVSRCPAPLPFTPSVPLTVCPVLLRAALLGEGGQKRCCCSPTQMPAVTDLEYDAFVMGQPRHSKQILVVCVTRLSWPVSTQAAPEQNPLEQLYRRRNKHRTMPCTQVWLLSYFTTGAYHVHSFCVYYQFTFCKNTRKASLLTLFFKFSVRWIHFAC